MKEKIKERERKKRRKEKRGARVKNLEFITFLGLSKKISILISKTYNH